MLGSRLDAVRMIERVDTTLVEVPLRAAVGTAIHAIESVGCVLTEVHTGDGPAGTSLVFTINGRRLRSLDDTIAGLASFAVGRSVHETAGIHDTIWREINATGHAGVTVSALSAIDVACWDAYARSIDQPLHHVFGSCRSTIDTYASSGLWLTASISELVEEAVGFVDAGFRAVKLRIGSPRPDDDVKRVSAVRDAIGPDIGLLLDANQGLTPKQAIRLGRSLEPYVPTWIEEPVAAGDLVGHSEVRTAIDTPIASGETVYTSSGIQQLIAAGAADVLMPDLQRIGGYTEFRRAAALAAAHHLPVSSHFFTEHSLAVAASLPNCHLVEHVDWFAPLFVEQMELVGGRLTVPDRPGHGFRFDPAALERYRLS